MGLSWARFGCSWGLLGGSFGAFAGSRWHHEFSKLFICAPLSSHLGPRGASNSPKRLPRRPHCEADGPTKPPNFIWRRIWTDFLMISDPTSMKKRKHLHVKPRPRILKHPIQVIGVRAARRLSRSVWDAEGIRRDRHTLDW